MRHQTVTLSKIEGMKQHRTDYDQWYQYQVVHDSVPDEDASAPWYGLVREYLGDIRGFRVLEVACGRGGFARQMAYASAQVVACDFSGTALRAAKAKMYPTGAPRLGSLIQADAQSLPFRDKSFDMVVSPNPQESSSSRHRTISTSWAAMKSTRAFGIPKNGMATCSSRVTAGKWFGKFTGGSVVRAGRSFALTEWSTSSLFFPATIRCAGNPWKRSLACGRF